MDKLTLEQLLHGNHIALQLVVDAFPFPVFYKDNQGRYLGCNKAYEEYTGLKRENILGKDVFSVFEEEAAAIFHRSDQELLNNPGIQIYETPVTREYQGTRFVKFQKATFLDEQGRVAGLIGAIIDITEQKELEQKLKKLASYDDLTDIYNRREGRKQLKKLARYCNRKQRPLTVMLIDLDNFKSINDRYGHDSGDRILKKAAKCLSQHSRANDVLCRYGGEEFLIVLPETDIEEALGIAERHRQALSQLSIEVGNHKTLHITASFGISEMDLNTSEQQLLKQADVALYKAKGLGKNRICC